METIVIQIQILTVLKTQSMLKSIKILIKITKITKTNKIIHYSNAINPINLYSAIVNHNNTHVSITILEMQKTI